jgi:hypothetical protein
MFGKIYRFLYTGIVIYVYIHVFPCTVTEKSLEADTVVIMSILSPRS